MRKIPSALAAFGLALVILMAIVSNVAGQSSAGWRAPYTTTGLPAPVTIHLAVLNQGGMQKICATFYDSGGQPGPMFCSGAPWYKGQLPHNAVWSISWTVAGAIPADGSIRVYGVNKLAVAPTGFMVFGAPAGSFSLTFFPSGD